MKLAQLNRNKPQHNKLAQHNTMETSHNTMKLAQHNEISPMCCVTLDLSLDPTLKRSEMTKHLRRDDANPSEDLRWCQPWHNT